MLVYVQALTAQSYIGRRETINYSKTQYNAGTQNWKIRQDAQGRMYFANNEGLLIFDGINWQLYPLPNKTIVRSIEFGNDKKIYVGGQDELGYFTPDKNGVLTFISIKQLLPKTELNFSDIWDIVSYGDEIFYRSHFKIFRYNHQKVTVYPSNSSWLFLGKHQNSLIAQDEQTGITLLRNGSWQTLIEKKNLPADFYITAITPFGKDSSLVTTAKNGLYILTGKQLVSWHLTVFGIDNTQLFSGALALEENNFLISTYLNGIYLVNKSGVVVENISKKEGLQNSNVRSMYMDVNRNLWLGLDNGIDYIAYNNAVKQINPLIFKDGGGYSVCMYQNSLFFSLSNGIYQLPVTRSGDLSYSTDNFKLLSEGQSWHLSLLNNNLLAGNDNGLFQIKNNSVIPIDRSYGFWTFQPLLNQPGASIIAAGHYYGVRLFELKGDQFINKGNLQGYTESARFLEIDEQNNIWTSHPYRGVYKLSAGSRAAKLYTRAQGLPSTLNNFVFKIKKQVVVATEKGIYQYNDNTDLFELSAQFKADVGTRSLRFLKDDPSGNLWFVEGKSVGMVDYSTKQHEIIYFPELNNRILSGFENIYPINDTNIFVGAENGFYHINLAKYKQNITPLKVYIRRVKAIANDDSLIFGGYFNTVNDNIRQPDQKIPLLGHIWNSLHFEYSSPVFEKQSNVEYSYLLQDFDKEWSGWSKKSEKDYTNLSPGTYTFKVKARNHQNNESAVYNYTFIIKSPWYQTIWAYVIYLLLFMGLIGYFYKLQEKRHLKNQEKQLQLQRQKNAEEQRQMAYLHQLELERSEKEVVKLKNEKLEADIEFKNSELASAAMNLVQKREFLLKVKEELQILIKSGKELIQNSEIKKILRLLTEDKKINEEWEQFSIHFNKVHGDFLTAIKEKYPAINQQELKLCAYLIMNLSSKEIAQLMCISVRGVEISRYRIRKKLHIPTETNLFEFLFELQRTGTNS